MSRDRESSGPFSVLARRSKFIVLIAGFFFGAVGSLWSYLYVDRVNTELSGLRERRAQKVKDIQSINSAAYDYFIANQQGDLIFVTALQANSRADVAGLLYKGNLLDRATPVRNLIGALALAKQLDYRAVYDAYEKLNDEARAALDFGRYTTLKNAERDVVARGQRYAASLQGGIAADDRQIAAEESKSQRFRVLGIAAALLGNMLLLTANLAGLHEGEPPRADGKNQNAG